MADGHGKREQRVEKHLEIQRPAQIQDGLYVLAFEVRNEQQRFDQAHKVGGGVAQQVWQQQGHAEHAKRAQPI
ncbi:hypothetical protein D3C76_1140090 [compost metagenome]